MERCDKKMQDELDISKLLKKVRESHEVAKNLQTREMKGFI